MHWEHFHSNSNACYEPATHSPPGSTYRIHQIMYLISKAVILSSHPQPLSDCKHAYISQIVS